MSSTEAERRPGAEEVAEQMRAATDRLREQAWLIAPWTSADEAMDTDPNRN